MYKISARFKNSKLPLHYEITEDQSKTRVPAQDGLYTVFYPSGNTIQMVPTENVIEIIIEKVNHSE